MADVRGIARSTAVSSMSKFLPKSETSLWVLSISQAVGMLALNVVLRAAVS